MTFIKLYGLHVRFIALFAILLTPLLAPAQTQTQCTSGVVDYVDNSNDGGELTDVEQTVCLYYDPQLGLDTYVRTDNDTYEDFNPSFGSSLYSGFQWVYGVGAEAQLVGQNGSSYATIFDSGMRYGSTDDTGGTPTSAPVGSAPQQYPTYYLSGLYSECGQQPDLFDSNGCSWGQYVAGTTYGLTVEMQFSGPPGPLAVATSGTPSLLGDTVTFRGSFTGASPTGNLTFYDGGTYLGTGTISSGTNLVQYSQQFGAPTWGGYCGPPYNMTVNTPDLQAPDGTMTATKFLLPAQISCGYGGTWGALTAIPGGLIAGQDYAVSVWLRGAVGGEYVLVGLNDCVEVPFLLSTSWQRFTASFPAISAGAAGCEGGRGFEMLGVTPNATYYAWGAQTEPSSSAGPYIPTLSTPQSGSVGVATFDTDSLPQGAHSITATWAGNASYPATTSTPITQIVNSASSQASTYDHGSVTLTVDNTSVTTGYGAGATGTSIATVLANTFNSLGGSAITATANSNNIGFSSTDSNRYYSYSLTTTYDTSNFSAPSFWGSVNATGQSAGDFTTGAPPPPIYKYTVPTGGYAANGNVLSYTDTVMGSWNFGYDSLDRLVTASETAPGFIPVPNLCWSYDPFGNRLQQAGSDVAFSWTPGNCATSGTLYSNVWASYDAYNHITQTNVSGTVFTAMPQTPIYDAGGNVVNDGTNQYVYDAEGRVCAVSNGNILYGYVYDAEGNRVAKGFINLVTVPGPYPDHPDWGSSQVLSCDVTANGFFQMWGYVIGTSGEQLTEVGVGNSQGDATVLHNNVWAGGKLLATYDYGGFHFHINDPLGTRRAQTDVNGNLEETYSSLPFGDGLTANYLIPNGYHGDPTENHFTGKERDAESGNDYMFARYYNSATGRFLSPDWSAKEDPVPYAKLDDPQSLNLYSYVGNSPVGRFDLDGHYFVVGAEMQQQVQQYISTLLRTPQGAATVNAIASSDLPVSFGLGTLPAVNNGDGTTSITAGRTVPVPGSSPGAIGGADVTLDNSNISRVADATGKSNFQTGLTAFAHEGQHVTDILSAKTFQGAAAAGADGDAPTQPGANNTTGGTAESRAQGIVGALGKAGKKFKQDKKYDGAAADILKQGAAQQQAEQ